ncbi:unnamed protein product [Phytophthora fragariaefolia]|uniref:Unnamed protein product n=1 Tax=Phytophthora fragariaefolia TaxID=1490495 RepID=A0A9W6Y6N9_9STRA|nr:unnamed protein product [Phytophthora fragariaefolia]
MWLITRFGSLKTSRYNKLDKIQSHQIFEMRSGEPGVVYCRKRPGSKPVVQNVLKHGVVKYFTEAERAGLWESFRKLDPPPLNKEKVHDIYKKVLPYVPPELRDDPLCIVPDDEDQQDVAATKRARRQKAPARANRASQAEPMSRLARKKRAAKEK